MKNQSLKNNYDEICNYINMYDKCYVDTWRGFSAYENIYKKQMLISRTYDIKKNKQLKLESLINKFKRFLSSFL